ncbi:phosphotransferase [Roseovarius sp. CH_XMU1461]|uniref:phosphotransferase n=1 Tax=Roseovarius sp. CH_XMU1461 TaxID=3107777 RepID=UPI00300B3F67
MTGPQTNNQTPDLASDIAALMDVSARLEAIAAADPVLAAVEFGEIIRNVPGRHAILHCKYNGVDAILRLATGSVDIGLDQTWEEMNRLWPHLRDGRLTMAEPLYYNAAQGALIVSRAEGQPLFALARQMPGPEALPMLCEAAQWLRHATRDSEADRAARPGPWRARAAKAAAKQPFAGLRALEDEILVILEQLEKHISGQNWRVAIIHGDFHPDNLLRSAQHLSGIDFGGSHRLPIYKDMARFLMHLGRRGLLPSGARWMGVDAALAQAFKTSFELSPFEAEILLPFFLGVEALLRVENRNLPDRRIRAARRMYEELLSDLTALAGRL